MDTLKYTTDDGIEIELSNEIVKKYLVKGSGIITDQEAYNYIQLCRAQGLNPYLGEAHLIKYGSSPATTVVGKESYTKRAENHPQFQGFSAGVVISKNGQVENRDGTIVLAGEDLIGGWCDVYRKDRIVPSKAVVSFAEYVGKKSDGSINETWRKRPGTMIRKVAVVSALREAFPTTFSGLYSEDEMPSEQDQKLKYENKQWVETKNETYPEIEYQKRKKALQELCEKYGQDNNGYKYARNVLDKIGSVSNKLNLANMDDDQYNGFMSVMEEQFRIINETWRKRPDTDEDDEGGVDTDDGGQDPDQAIQSAYEGG
jgi:phage recombination protein Bet